MTEAVSNSTDDAVLVKQCQNGDANATEQLILKYQDRIYNTILRMVANPDDAADLTQETFVKVIEKVDTFQGRSSFYTWLFRIAVNLTLSYCKRATKLTFRSLEAPDGESSDNARQMLKDYLQHDGTTDPAVLAANNELVKLIVRAMTKLDDSQRAVIVLRDIEGMNYMQIAEVLELEMGTVKSRLSRGRSNLKQIMEVFLK